MNSSSAFDTDFFYRNIDQVESCHGQLKRCWWGIY